MSGKIGALVSMNTKLLECHDQNNGHHATTTGVLQPCELFPTSGDIVLHVYMKDLFLEVGR